MLSWLDREQVRLEVVRSSRKTTAIQVVSSRRVVVRAPHRAPAAAIERAVEARSGWIMSALERQAARERSGGPMPTELEFESWRQLAKTDLPARVHRWAPMVGCAPSRIHIRNQATRWGSCSSSGTLSLNLQLMRFPDWVRDYVVVHELAHLVHPNHGPDFWALVARTFPSHREARALLREAVIFR